MVQFDLVMPVVADDLAVLRHFEWDIRRQIPYRYLILIGNGQVQERLGQMNRQRVRFINEDDLVPYDKVKNIISEMTDGDVQATARTGWYLQQFLKMEYSRRCKDEYYLLWDSDTVPLKSVQLFEDGKPIFHLKTEKHLLYFDTLKALFPNISNTLEQSFIAEHMLIKTDIMKKMILDIEKNSAIKGSTFYEKILFAINKEDLKGSGFSEFETYGNYCLSNFADVYKLKQWNSLREGSKYFDNELFGEREIEWLHDEYDAVSFEKTIRKMYGYSVFHRKSIQEKFSFEKVRKVMEIYHVIVRGLNRLGRMIKGDFRTYGEAYNK